MKQCNFCIFFLVTLFLSCQKEMAYECLQGEKTISYPIIAHSHNDYEHNLPIFAALNHGFTSLEVDIFHDGKTIRISHDDKNLKDKPLFEDNYFFPLINELNSNPRDLILLIDIKHFSKVLLSDLKSILEKYEENLVTRTNVLDVENKVKIVLSGEIPRKELIDDMSNKYIFVDGRYNDSDIGATSEIVPIISIDFTDLTRWKGSRKLSKRTRIYLENIIESVHTKGKLIRFWETKNKEAIWQLLIDLEVDIIGVDETERFCQFMQENGLIK